MNTLLKQIVSLAYKELKLSGFKKVTANNLRSENDDFYFFINFQSSSTSTNEQCFFVINIGISSKKILVHKNHKIPNSLVNCISEWRLNSSLETTYHNWWMLNNDTNINLVFLDVMNEIETNAKPRFDKFGDEKNMVDYLIDCIKQSEKTPSFSLMEPLLVICWYRDKTLFEEQYNYLYSVLKNPNDLLFLREVRAELK